MHFSKEIGESLTYRFAQAAGEMKAQGKEIISLGLGEPDFSTPDYVVDATIDAMKNGYTHYSATQGLPELRNLIAKKATADYGTAYDASEVIVLPGIKPAVYDALAAVLEPFDEVILISPYYVSYPAMVKLAEPTAEIVNVKLNKDYTLDTEALKEAFHKNTKAILVNSPHNPTGMMFSENEIRLITELCIRNHVYLIADEVYEKLTYSGNCFISFAQYPQLKEYLVVTNGYSKSHAMTGWRLGYAIGPTPIIRKMNRIQQHVNTNTCTFIQKGACSIYEHKPEHLIAYIAELEKRVDFFDSTLRETGILQGTKPKAGFFYFVDISKTGMDSNSFCVKLLQETGIATTPGLAFGKDWDDHVRFSLAVSMQILQRAMDLLIDFIHRNFK